MSEDPLAEIRAEYLDSLPARFTALEALRSELADGRLPATRRKDLLRELHSLAGSGKTFGFPAVTDAARAAESFLEPFSTAEAAPSAGDWARLKQLIEALQGAVLPTTR